MIDIHHHCLPGIDDGPDDWDEAIEQCRMAESEGIDTIIATPHVRRGPWLNEDRRVLQKLTLDLNQQLGGTPKVILGCEYFFSHDILEVLDQDGGIVPLAGSRCILIEFPSMSVPPRIGQILYEVILRGWSPVIAHPERNFVFQEKLKLLRELVEQGVRLQVTTGSLEGAFGARARKSATDLMNAELVHFLATDAHNTTRRPPRVREASGIVEKRWGKERARFLFEDNPRALLEQRPLPYDPDQHRTHRSAFSSIFGRVLEKLRGGTDV